MRYRINLYPDQQWMIDMALENVLHINRPADVDLSPYVFTALAAVRCDCTIVELTANEIDTVRAAITHSIENDHTLTSSDTARLRDLDRHIALMDRAATFHDLRW